MISEQKIDPTKRQNLEDEFETFLQEFFTKREIKEDDTMISTISSSSYTTGSSSKGKFPYLVSTPMDRPYSKQELFVRQHQHSKHMAKLGSQIEDVYLPHEDVLKPVKPSKLSIQTLLSAGCHLGHSTSLWRPSTQPFIYGEYKGIHIIDLEQTLTYLKRAAKVVEGIAERGGLILFLGTREGQKKSLEQAAKRTNGYYVSNRWIPGSITNCTEINGIWPRHELDMEDKPTQRELEPAELDSLIKPDLIVILNPIENRNCIREAIQSRIPTIGLVDTDSEPSLLTYPIPCNDDSIRATNLVIGVLSKAGEIGRKRRLENVADYKKSLGLATESAIFNERR
ncbi:hypothetical protein PACTADRAFT_38392 [Pachysolen tannophilus NRRL Y-2460]|uniref:Ribosomal protein S2 n=1 Tax=Pachysolen tannophilus NRRL Y-2460 TaxID=669874 RepID=A0A1E4U1B2_PACTA|nr:hypothetical protein PACTADRAFT_38392 [Pachysolen tannophilus NRRL Y-2460]